MPAWDLPIIQLSRLPIRTSAGAIGKALTLWPYAAVDHPDDDTLTGSSSTAQLIP